MAQGGCNHFRDDLLSEPTSATTRIQQCVETFGHLFFHKSEPLPPWARERLLLGFRERLFALGSPTQDDRLGKGIRKSEANGVDAARSGPVRKIGALSDGDLVSVQDVHPTVVARVS